MGGLSSFYSIPFRNMTSSIYRWGYVSGEGERAEMLPKKKKEQESEFLRSWIRKIWIRRLGKKQPK